MQRSASFELLSIEGSKTFFALHVNNEPLIDSFPPVVSDNFSISGSLIGTGGRSTVHVTYGWKRGNSGTFSTSSSHEADVVLDLRNVAVRVAFVDPTIVRAITVGTDVAGMQ
jgi:hypothetical protein